jgi:hypothetical protein
MGDVYEVNFRDLAFKVAQDSISPAMTRMALQMDLNRSPVSQKSSSSGAAGAGAWKNYLSPCNSRG